MVLDEDTFDQNPHTEAGSVYYGHLLLLVCLPDETSVLRCYKLLKKTYVCAHNRRYLMHRCMSSAIVNARLGYCIPQHDCSAMNHTVRMHQTQM